MEIETLGLGAGSYPEPPEPKEKLYTIKVKMYVESSVEVYAESTEQALEEVNNLCECDLFDEISEYEIDETEIIDIEN